MNNKMRYFIPLAIAITGIFGFIALINQHALRQNANDPQIEISENAANAFSEMLNWDKYPPSSKIDIDKSLSSFMILYNADEKVFASTGELDGKTPDLPKGVLDYTKEHGEEILTWQPKDGVRISAVVRYFKGKSSGFALAGRNLREIEKRQDQYMAAAIISWTLTLTATFVATILFVDNKKKK